ncbi:MAG: hypothetical protein ACXVIW_07445, partial [Halobacteriota archaeon]
GVDSMVRSIGPVEEKAAANGFWSRAFGVERYFCSEASGEFALALKHAAGGDHFRDSRVLQSPTSLF